MRTVTLAEFLAARLDEDEAAAKGGGHLQWNSAGPYLGWEEGGIAAQFKFTDDATHAARHDPARVLREVAAKRAILDRHDFNGSTEMPGCSWCQPSVLELDDGQEVIPWPCREVLDLAAVWADHPDYKQEWKPAL